MYSELIQVMRRGEPRTLGRVVYDILIQTSQCYMFGGNLNTYFIVLEIDSGL